MIFGSKLKTDKSKCRHPSIFVSFEYPGVSNPGSGLSIALKTWLELCFEYLQIPNPQGEVPVALQTWLKLCFELNKLGPEVFFEAYRGHTWPLNPQKALKVFSWKLEAIFFVLLKASEGHPDLIGTQLQLGLPPHPKCADYIILRCFFFSTKVLGIEPQT